MNYELLIVGGGPAGLSAAARAGELGLSYLLLESTSTLANTIQRYQKGKHVMAEPAVVPLRSDLDFAAGTREAVLDSWQQGLNTRNIKIRYGAEVVSITGSRPEFELSLSDGEVLTSSTLVLSIGLPIGMNSWAVSSL